MSISANVRPATRLDVEVIAREPMTSWFAPGQLAMTGVKVALGLAFGAYLDRREVEAALLQQSAVQDAAVLNYADRDDVWIDYLADTGDGWDSTYSIALLVAQARLSLGGIELPRGDLLVMGGDEVYPTSTVDDYQRKLRNPYSSALPWLPEAQRPDLFVLPGNHDWYDGLASFLKVFCQRRSIGAWRTRQTRSYFVLKLPHDWWLWAVDIQLETDIDFPQIAYFDYFASQLRSGHRVILCTPTSSWTEAGDEAAGKQEERSHRNLSFLEDRIRARGAEVAVNLAGDLHHYSHYVSEEKGTHKLTAGGGGAYLFGTHELPAELHLYEGRETKERYAMKTAYPDATKSKRLRVGALGFFYKNLAFSAFLGGLYVFYSWLLQAASKTPNPHIRASLMQDLHDTELGIRNFFCIGLLKVYWVLAHSPFTALFTLFIVVSLWAYCDSQKGLRGTLKRIALGGGHGVGHVLLAILILWVFSTLNLGPIATWVGHAGDAQWVDHPLQVLLFLVETMVAGSVLGGTLMGAYLVIANFAGLHGQDVFSAQAIPDYKNFLRLHISRDQLTIYSIGVDKVHRKWRPSPAATVADPPSGLPRGSWAFSIPRGSPGPWLQPDDDLGKPFLIEPPIEIARR
jgi:hypothetical protein